MPYFIDFWRKVTSNNLVLNIVQFGLKLQFFKFPPFITLSSGQLSSSRSLSISKEVSTLLSKSAIVAVAPSKEQFVSPIFDIPKKDCDDRRVILNLKTLNKFIIKTSFKLEGYEEITNMIRKGDYFISINLKDAYLTFLMHPYFWKYLCFDFLNTRYHYKVMPFGLTSAPRIFTKVFKTVLVFLRSRGLRISAWFDDIILVANSLSLILEQMHFTMLILKSLGFIPHPEKSMLTPSQEINHLGFNWNSVDLTISVPVEKVIELKKLCAKALGLVKLRFLNKILGTIENFRIGFPYAALHYRGIQHEVAKYIRLDYDWDYSIKLSDAAIEDLNWWLNCPTSLPPKPLDPFLPELTLVTDSSETGWGAFSSDDTEVSGFWSDEESSLHINLLETQAIYLALRSLFRDYSNISILIKTDNTTSVAYINNLGGAKNPCISKIINDIYDFCIQKGFRIQASHLCGRLNSRADSLSRKPRVHCYSLSLKTFTLICKNFSFKPLVDLFASRLNHKVNNYYSEGPDPFASAFDAFITPWPHSVYAFPPIHLVQQFITTFLNQSIEFGLLICPFWPSQPYFPSLLNIMIDNPLIISASLVENASTLPCNISKLMGCFISSNSVRQRAFQQKQPLASYAASIQIHCAHTYASGSSFPIGVLHDRSILAYYL